MPFNLIGWDLLLLAQSINTFVAWSYTLTHLLSLMLISAFLTSTRYFTNSIQPLAAAMHTGVLCGREKDYNNTIRTCSLPCGLVLH